MSHIPGNLVRLTTGMEDVWVPKAFCTC